MKLQVLAVRFGVLARDLTRFARMKGVKKQDLPTKICPACQRPFAWRKKWAKNWDEVKFCSQACRDGRYQSARNSQLSPDSGVK